MTQIEFRVEWGYTTIYSRRHYHPEYCWNGKIDCTAGIIRSVSQYKYPWVWLGSPVFSPKETPLDGNEWKCTLRRNVSGIKVVADCEESSEFILTTAQGTFTFSARQILNDGRIIFPIGSKYSYCSIIVTREGFLWFRPAPRRLETVVEPTELKGTKMVNWARMDQAWIEPEKTVEFDVVLPEFKEDGEKYWLFHLQGMTAQEGELPDQPPSWSFEEVDGKLVKSEDGKEMANKAASGYIIFEICSNDYLLKTLRYYFRSHDADVQVLHDVWGEIPFDELPAGKHHIKLINRHNKLPLLVNRISFRPKTRRHLAMTAPAWTLVGREFILGVQILKSLTTVQFKYDNQLFSPVTQPKLELTLDAGYHEFRFIPLKACQNARICVEDIDSKEQAEIAIPAIYDLKSETPELAVGYDMTTVSHDDTGEMDWLLDYTQRTQLGNLVVFRSFTSAPVKPEVLSRWGRFCKDHGIYFQAVNCFEDGSLPKAGGEYCQGLGGHELSGTTYALDPDDKSSDMKEAMERFIDYMRENVNKIRPLGKKVSFGDASGGHRYSLMAGADFLRAETMVPNTTLLCSQARPAAQSLGNGEWGAHIAIHHPKQPDIKSEHLGWYYLSLLQPWMMGATFIYEEDSLFLMFKEERQCWDDALTKGKRDMTREFFRFAQTHPRTGRPEIPIATILGRYAAPFNGFICGAEQGPWYSVWGKYGKNDPTWSHCQPEKGQQVMDVLMPGASTLPFRQRYDRRRLFFAATPYGDFDQIPVEAEREFFARYKLLMHLCWNTMIPEDYTKSKKYVEDGGTLFLSAPHLSTHQGRDFLADMEDLALYDGGNVADLCGVKILGRGVRYCGHWHPVDNTFAGATCPPQSRVPSVSPDEDGPCHLAEVEMHGAKPVIIDAISGKPLLVEYSLGKGKVFLMTTWAYPGHEELAEFSGAVVARLCQNYMGSCVVDDPAAETFWTCWTEGNDCGKLLLLNMDWTKHGAERTVTITTPAVGFEIRIRERQVCIITYLPFGAIVQSDSQPHVEILQADSRSAKLRIHVTGRHQFSLHTRSASVDITTAGTTIKTNADVPQRFIFEIENTQLTYADYVVTVGGL